MNCDVLKPDNWQRKLKLSDTAAAPPSLPGGRANVAVVVDDDIVDARDIDKVLNEMSALSLRYAAFRRFVASNFEVPEFPRMKLLY